MGTAPAETKPPDGCRAGEPAGCERSLHRAWSELNLRAEIEYGRHPRSPEATPLQTPSPDQVVLVRAGPRVCALPVASVVETMRPRPIAPLAGVPPFVAGVAVVRGEPVPVVHLGAFLGDAAPGAPARFVTVRAGPRLAALAVDAVIGVAALPARDAAALPLLADACAGAVEALRARDDGLLVVLRTARLVPDDVGRALDAWRQAP